MKDETIFNTKVFKQCQKALLLSNYFIEVMIKTQFLQELITLINCELLCSFSVMVMVFLQVIKQYQLPILQHIIAQILLILLIKSK